MNITLFLLTILVHNALALLIPDIPNAQPNLLTKIFRFLSQEKFS